MTKDQIETAKAALLEKSTHSTDGVMRGCTSYVQRKLQIGYNLTATILDELVKTGFITDPDQTGARRLLPQ